MGKVGNKLNVVSTTVAAPAAGDYAAEDVISNSTSAGVVWTFSNVVDRPGTGGYIVYAMILCETTAVAHTPILYLYTSSTTSGETDDNKANDNPVHADAANYVGSITFPAMSDYGGDAQAIVSKSSAGMPVAFNCAAGDTNLYGILVTTDGEAGETATDDYIIKLTIEPA